MSDPIVVHGVLGWGNRKSGLEAYGPGGRWDNLDPGGGAHPRSNPDGDLLGDALDRAGAHEGATLLVIAVDRFGDTSVLERVAAALNAAPATPAERAVIDAAERWYDDDEFGGDYDPLLDAVIRLRSERNKTDG